MSWFYWVLIVILSSSIIGQILILMQDEIKPRKRAGVAGDLAIGIFLLIGCLLWL